MIYKGASFKIIGSGFTPGRVLPIFSLNGGSVQLSITNTPPSVPPSGTFEITATVEGNVPSVATYTLSASSGTAQIAEVQVQVCANFDTTCLPRIGFLDPGTGIVNTFYPPKVFSGDQLTVTGGGFWNNGGFGTADLVVDRECIFAPHRVTCFSPGTSIGTDPVAFSVLEDFIYTVDNLDLGTHTMSAAFGTVFTSMSFVVDMMPKK